MRKITAKQREELVRLWLDGEFHKLQRRHRELGVSPGYTRRVAFDRGLRRTRSDGDPRWQWAIERGPVIA